jgi:integrase/recombinase XerD
VTSEPWTLTREMFLTPAEAGRLLQNLAQAEADPGEPAAAVDRVIIELLLLTGIKNSEFCRLTPSDVVLHRKGPRSTGDATSGAIRVSSSPKERREVILPRRVAVLLERYLRDVRPALKLTGYSARDASGPLVPNERGNFYDRTALYRRVVRILTAQGFGERASVQLLRHTYGYLAYLGTGGNLLFVQKQLGHAHPMVTAIYSEFVTFDEAALADLVDPLAATGGRGVTKPKSRSSRKGVQP